MLISMTDEQIMQQNRRGSVDGEKCLASKGGLLYYTFRSLRLSLAAAGRPLLDLPQTKLEYLCCAHELVSHFSHDIGNRLTNIGVRLCTGLDPSSVILLGEFFALVFGHLSFFVIRETERGNI